MKNILFTSAAIAFALSSANAVASDAMARLGATIPQNCNVVADLDITLEAGATRSGDVEITCNDYDGVKLILTSTQGGLVNDSNDGKVNYAAKWEHSSPNLTSVEVNTLNDLDEAQHSSAVLGSGGELANLDSSQGTLSISVPGDGFKYAGAYHDSLQLALEVQ